MNERCCLVTGVGHGTGRALVERFADDGYRVAMLARRTDRLATFERELAGTRAYPCDVADARELERTVARVIADLGPPAVVIHNAVSAERGTFLEIEPAGLEQAFRVNCMGLLHLARATVPAMIERGGGALICTGNTAAYRGRAAYAGFAPSKAAQRVLAESMARELGPRGIHVAYVMIDAVIDLRWTRRAWPDRPDSFFIKPRDIAAEVFHVAHQPRSAWSFRVEIRPHGENW